MHHTRRSLQTACLPTAFALLVPVSAGKLPGELTQRMPTKAYYQLAAAFDMVRRKRAAAPVMRIPFFYPASAHSHPSQCALAVMHIGHERICYAVLPFSNNRDRHFPEGSAQT